MWFLGTRGVGRGGEDLGVDVGLLEVAIVGGEGDLAVEEEEDVDLEFGSEGGGEPDAVGLGGVDDGEAEAGDVGAEEQADGEGEFSGHGGADEDGLEGGGVDESVALPVVVVGVFGGEGDVEAVAAVHGSLAEEVECVGGLLFGCEGEEVGADAVFRFAGGEIVAHVFDEVTIHGLIVVDGVSEGFVLCVRLRVFGGCRVVFGGGEGGVGDVGVVSKEASVDLEELLLRARAGGGEAGVGGLFAADGLAFARGDVGVLDVNVAGAICLGGVLMGGDAGHDGVGGELLRAGGQRCEGKDAG